MTPGEHLKRSYGRFVLPELDGSFRAEIMEFPGCIATGETAAEALSNLENVAESWLEATMAKGQRVPEPVDSNSFSGKLVVRLPKNLHRKAAHAAARDGVSLNQFIVSSVAEQVGVRASAAPLAQMFVMTQVPVLTNVHIITPTQAANLLPAEAHNISTLSTPGRQYARS